MINVVSARIADRATSKSASTLASDGVQTGFGAAREDQARMYATALALIDDRAIDMKVFGSDASDAEIAGAKSLIRFDDELEVRWDDHFRRHRESAAA